MLIILAKISECKGSIPPSSYYVELPDYQSQVLALYNQQTSCSCCWCKSKELGGRRSPRFPCVTPVMERFFSDFLGVIISYWAGSHLGSCQTSCPISTIELFCENSQRSQHVDYFRKEAPPQMFDWIPDAPPIEGIVNVGSKQTASARNL